MRFFPRILVNMLINIIETIVSAGSISIEHIAASETNKVSQMLGGISLSILEGR